MTTTAISVLIVDDQLIIRDALQALLSQAEDLDVLGVASNGLEAVEKAKELKPDVVLLDVRMPLMAGPDAARRIRATRGLENTSILMLTTFEDADVVHACVDAGADGFIGKGSSTSALIEAIRAVRHGEMPLSPRAASAVLRGRSTLPRATETATQAASLTIRETEILRLVSEGLSNDEIARAVTISPATAQTHVRNIMRKLRMRDRAQLVAFAHRAGLAG